jgi:Ca-activated chloride channel homolog
MRLLINRKYLRGVLKIALVTLLAWSSPRDAAFAFTPGSRAERSYREENYEDALDIYERALKKRPDNPTLEYNRAVVLYRKDDFISSEEAFMRSAILGERDLEARSAYNAGNAKYRIGEEIEFSNTKGAIEKYTEALDYYRRAMDLAPEDVDAKYNYEFVSKRIDDLESQQDQEEEEQQDQQEEEQQDEQDQQEEEQQDERDQQEEEQQDEQDQQKEEQQDEQDQKEEEQRDEQDQKEEDRKDEREDPKPDEERDRERPDSGDQEEDKQDPEPGTGDSGSMSRQEAELLLEQQEEEENRVRAQQKQEREDSRPPVLMDW